MRLMPLSAVMAVALVLPVVAQDVSPEDYWAGFYQAYWDEVAAYNDCAENAAFCADSTRRRCEELWFMRNQLFNTAGQCFASPLGQAMFDNADCTTDTASLGSFHAEYVAHIKAEEKVLNCAVDTSATAPLEIMNLADRMNAYPFFDGESAPSGCIGWKGPEFYLYADPATDAPVVAQVQQGANLSVYLESYAQPGAWWYYTIFGEDGFGAEGWGPVEVFPPAAFDLCESYAG